MRMPIRFLYDHYDWQALKILEDANMPVKEYDVPRTLWDKIMRKPAVKKGYIAYPVDMVALATKLGFQITNNPKKKGQTVCYVPKEMNAGEQVILAQNFAYVIASKYYDDESNRWLLASALMIPVGSYRAMNAINHLHPDATNSPLIKKSFGVSENILGLFYWRMHKKYQRWPG